MKTIKCKKNGSTAPAMLPKKKKVAVSLPLKLNTISTIFKNETIQPLYLITQANKTLRLLKRLLVHIAALVDLYHQRMVWHRAFDRFAM
jgi:hypothetical protein